MVRSLLILILLVSPAIGVPYNNVVNTAMEDIGIDEKGGNNQGFTSLDFELRLREQGWKKGYAWCSYSVMAWLNENNVPNTITGWSPTSFNKKDVIFTDNKFVSKFHRDDVMVMSLSYDKFKNDKSRYKGIGHTGVVKRLYRSSMVTIEGNTNDLGERDSRAGDGVYLKRRPLTRSTHITRWKKYNQQLSP